MKTYTSPWNYDLKMMPTIGDKIRIDFGNGIGSDRRFPYLVETINEEIRGNYKVFYVEGRQLKKDGSLKNNWFQLMFTDKPKVTNVTI